VSIGWYFVPPGGHLARAAKPVLVAKGSARFATAGRRNVVIKLTRQGRRLLTGKRKLALQAKGRFTPRTGRTVTVVKRFTLKR
jgi:hypothetical protein